LLLDSLQPNGIALDPREKYLYVNDNASQSIMRYEVQLTARLIGRGFKAGAYITEPIEVNRGGADDHLYAEHFPIFLMDRGAPLIKVKSLREANCNCQGIDRTLQWVARANPSIYRQAMSHNAIARYDKTPDIAFSIIMPTYNRRHVLDQAIGSVLAQWHRSFELIIVDDGSEDGTESHIRSQYAKEIKVGSFSSAMIGMPVLRLPVTSDSPQRSILGSRMWIRTIQFANIS